MRKIIMSVLVALFVIGMVSTVSAGQNGNEYAYNQEDGPLRDGSCRDTTSSILSDGWNGGNGLGDGLHLQDGTCDGSGS